MSKTRLPAPMLFSFGLLSVLLASTAGAATPSMGGPMKHIMVERVGNNLVATIDDSIATPVLTQYAGAIYSGPAAVLNQTAYNSQYGWTVEGFWDLPPGGTLWLEQIAATPGLAAYSPAFAPIFATAGSAPRIAWDGVMLHNWYATHSGGPHFAEYTVYFGNDQGAPLPGYGAATVRLTWESSLPACPADLNADGFVDDTDFVIFAQAYDLFDCGSPTMPAACPADLNTDGYVDDTDFVLFAQQYDLFACP